MVHLIHISDVHVGDAPQHLLDDALQAIAALRPDCVVATGDLTQSGRRHEFAALQAFLNGIAAPIVGCPGNHDSPVYNPLIRAVAPFSRFERLGLASLWRAPCQTVAVCAFNSARAVQLKPDWSQGSLRQNLEPALTELKAQPAHWRVLACHHPPLTPPGARVASRPAGASQALRRLAGEEQLLLLAGHLHGSFRFQLGPGAECLVAPSLASRRGRGQEPGFTSIRLGTSGPATVETWSHDGQRFALATPAGAPTALVHA